MFQPKVVPGIYGKLPELEWKNDDDIERLARGFLEQMTLDEKIGQMCAEQKFLPAIYDNFRKYNNYPIPAGENFRLGIPGIRFADGPRGCVLFSSTCFPVSIARGATFNTALEEEIGDAIGVEARSQGANFYGGVCINLLRHPAWGRAQETYGEDPFHVGEMGSALLRGVQRHMMGCIKHYALNSMENMRFKVNVRVKERPLHEIYLRHFKRCIDEGAASVMSAYNKVNGKYCGHNAPLLKDILRKKWRFRGIVISDFFLGIRNALEAALGGVDIEMPCRMHYSRKLKKLVKKGDVPETLINESVMNILRTKIRFSKVGEPERYNKKAVLCPEHIALARRAAAESMVLLKNNSLSTNSRPLLPLDLSAVKRIAVIGFLADFPNPGDRGSSRVYPPYTITPLEGIRSITGEYGIDVVYHNGKSITSAAKVAADADVAILIVGYTHKDEGENFIFFGGDRKNLELSSHDESLIRAVAGANKNCVVCIEAGSAVIMENWRTCVPAILYIWYPGMEGGNALAEILFGMRCPGGKLPFCIPQSVEHLPYFDAKAKDIEYDMYHGYRLLDRDGNEPAFAFGFGLSYTTFRIGKPVLSVSKISVNASTMVSVDVTNTGDMSGSEVIQIYVSYPYSAVERPKKELKGFTKLHLKPKEMKTATITISAKDFAYYDEKKSDWVVEKMVYTLLVGTSSRPNDLTELKLEVI
ncbi:MAG: glycoside hydrolase family 3 C-terminal domain-containing protein [Spirochaetota bacterium]